MNNTEEVDFKYVHSKSTRVGEGIPPEKTFMPELSAYSIKREIGRGGMAVVYEAIEKSLNRTVALKVLSRELSRDTDLINRFVNEAQAAARLSHPNIVQIYSIGQEKGVYYFAMEYVRGESVEDILAQKKRIPLKQCIAIIRQTMLALQEAYKNKIVHRDIKPGNLLITEHGLVKVADFGLAGEIKDKGPTVVGGKIIGTPLYISPEQAQGKEGDCRSDIYSLGITFYQMLSGDPPFLSSDTKILMKNHIEKPIPQLPANVPAAVKKLVYRMTEKNLGKRFQDYNSLLKEMDRINRILSAKRYTFPLLSIGLVLSIGITIYSLYYSPKSDDLALRLQIDKNKQIESIYNSVAENARKNPESYEYNIEEYIRFADKYKGTEWAYRAEQKIDIIMNARSAEANKDFKTLRPICDKLIKEKRYKEAMDKYEVIKDRYKDTLTSVYAQGRIDSALDDAIKDFQLRNEKGDEYIAQNKFNDARKLYSEVINNYGLEKFVAEAESKLLFINDKEENYRIGTEANNIFEPLEKKIEELISKNKYSEARILLEDVEKVKENLVLAELVKNELAKIDDLQIKYESTALTEKMESQFNVYNEINKKIVSFIADYKYNEAVKTLNEGMANIEAQELKRKLEALQEKLQYLVLLKDAIISGINKELALKNAANISADSDTLIFIVEGGYVGVPWKETEANKIYQLAQKYTTSNADTHIALGIFCLTYDLKEEASKEFTIALRMEPEKERIIEKYFIQLAETKRK